MKPWLAPLLLNNYRGIFLNVCTSKSPFIDCEVCVCVCVKARIQYLQILTLKAIFR